VYIDGKQFVEVTTLDVVRLERSDEWKVEVEFNLRFLLALDCYVPGVAKELLRDCREDIKMFGFEFAQKKWSRFIEYSLNGRAKPIA
jgi:hypothetical protein